MLSTEPTSLLFLFIMKKGEDNFFLSISAIWNFLNFLFKEIYMAHCMIVISFFFFNSLWLCTVSHNYSFITTMITIWTIGLVFEICDYTDKTVNKPLFLLFVTFFFYIYCQSFVFVCVFEQCFRDAYILFSIKNKPKVRGPQTAKKRRRNALDSNSNVKMYWTFFFILA